MFIELFFSVAFSYNFHFHPLKLTNLIMIKIINAIDY